MKSLSVIYLRFTGKLSDTHIILYETRVNQILRTITLRFRLCTKSTTHKPEARSIVIFKLLATQLS